MTCHRTPFSLASRLLHGALMALTFYTPALAFHLGQEDPSPQAAESPTTNASLSLARLIERRFLLITSGATSSSCGSSSNPCK